MWRSEIYRALREMIPPEATDSTRTYHEKRKELAVAHSGVRNSLIRGLPYIAEASPGHPVVRRSGPHLYRVNRYKHIGPTPQLARLALILKTCVSVLAMKPDRSPVRAALQVRRPHIDRPRPLSLSQ
jgi:hypothetical protein